MEDIYANVDYEKNDDRVSMTWNVANSGEMLTSKDKSRSKKGLGWASIVFLAILSVSLLAGLITLWVFYDNSKTNLELSNEKLLLMTEERDALNKTLEEMVKNQASKKSVEGCPPGWVQFRCSCYFSSTETGSWENGLADCRSREADYVVINDKDEQDFVIEFTQKNSWIGLTDQRTEGKWSWVDGSPLTESYWCEKQPDNGGGDSRWGEEDCADVDAYWKKWNDLSCETSLGWICEKKA